MTAITATPSIGMPTLGADRFAQIAGLPSSTATRASVGASLTPAAERLEIEFARKALEQAFKRTYVPVAAPSGSWGRNLAKAGPLALGFLAWMFLTSGGERNLGVLLGKIPGYVSADDLQMASEAATSAGWNTQKKPAGLDTSDKLGRFIVGAAELGRLYQQGKITQPMLAAGLSRLHANVVAGRPPAQGLFDPPRRTTPPQNFTPARPTRSPTKPTTTTQKTRTSAKPVPQVPPLPKVNSTVTVPAVAPLPKIATPVRPDGKAAPRSQGSPVRRPDLPTFPKEFDYTDAGLTKLLKSAGSATLRQRVNDYRNRRTTRDQATHGLKGATKASMNSWLDAIDRSRLPPGGANGGRSAAVASGSGATKTEFPPVKASKNILPDGQPNLKNKIVKNLISATDGKLSRGQAVQLANLIGDKYPKEVEALKIAALAAESINSGHSIERIAYALASSVRHSKLLQHLMNSPTVDDRTHADAFIKRCESVKNLPQDQRAEAVVNLISGKTTTRRQVETTEKLPTTNTAATLPVSGTKPVPPGLDTSSWNLPMGETGDTFFGKQRVSTNYLPRSNPSQTGETTALEGGKPKSFKELQASLLGSSEEDRSLSFIGNKFRSVARNPNEQFAIDLFKTEKSIANHFLKRPFADRPGESPTSFLYGGHAVQGAFANITGKNYTEIAKKILLKVDELVKSGVLIKIGAGGTNGVYLNKQTQQVIRVGRVSSNELQASIGFSKIGDSKVGAKIDLAQSLYLPNELDMTGKTEGFAVLVMERVPGMRLAGNGYLLSSSAKAKIAPAVADALVSMHLNNKAHGDFGTHNVNVTATGEVRVIDFDLSSPVKNPRSLSNDLDGLVSVLLELYPSSRAYGKEQVRAVAIDLYVKALDRAAGPDRNAEIYKKHPELYAPHVARFNAKKQALKNAASNAFK